MSYRKATILAIFSAAGLLVGWDIWVVTHQPSATISGIFLGAAEVHGTWAYLFGVLGVHLTWPIRSARWSARRWLIGIGAGVACAALAWFVPLLPVLWLLAGAASGRFIFPQFEG